MGYGQQYGRNGLWRARYKRPDGTYGSQPGFKTEEKAKKWADLQESKIEEGTWKDPKSGTIRFGVWVAKWREAQDLAESTMAKYNYDLDTLILPFWERWEIGNISPIEVARWEKKLRKRYKPSVVAGAHARLHTLLEDAVDEKLIDTNPAKRRRRRGQQHAEAQATEESLWATAMQVLLIAERCAVISGRAQDFVLVVMAAWSGLRWSEASGLEKPYCRTKLHQMVRVEWHTAQVDKFYRRPPKKISRRDVQEPPFLCALLDEQLASTKQNRCECTHQLHPNEYVFLGPDKGHLWRGNWSERVFRPACDGFYPAQGKARPARPVMVDLEAGFPGCRVDAWPYASGSGWAPPAGPGRRRLAAPDGAPLEGMPLATWLPIVEGLTFHDLRHSHKTWLIEAGIPEVAQAERLGHRIAGVQGIYSHVTDAMRLQILEALQQLWEDVLRARFELCPRSAAPVLDRLLKPYRKGAVESAVATIGGDKTIIANISPLRGGSRRVRSAR
ncbi:tyrosine-type recombinase/integrase [Actinomadura scrupuli]|uniref:tyrosine-type recombinase/integrase n=1 Tax=Actinomadura scrupuli TaxID=559629 RepID=UPI003D95DCC5